MSRAAIAVLAISGQALMNPDDLGRHRDEVRAARRAARSVATLVREGYRVLVVHGNGPQVGRELLRNEETATKAPPRPLDACVAATCGTVGYLLATETRNELRRLRIAKPVSVVLLWTLVGLDDPAFRKPDRALGPIFNAWRARAQRPGEMQVTEVEGGWQRVVPCPRPLEILNLDAIEALLDRGQLVIVGGGGVPVAVDARGQFVGVEAVVDEDLTAALLAEHLGAEVLAFVTESDQVFANLGRTDQRSLDRVTASEVRAVAASGALAGGGLERKVEAALEFVDDGGLRAIITSAERFAAALADRAGTRITRVVDNGPVRRQIDLFPAAETGDLFLEEDA